MEGVPAYIAFVESLIRDGYAYESNRSIYFDSRVYRELKWSRKDVSDEKIVRAMADAEMESFLTVSEFRSPGDFLLWRALSSGSNKSPWGRGYPGKDIRKRE